ncbi:MAG: polysaccharide deacetylase family protein [Lachnospiraceae bacterium]|nr:polysaccharide deacetylase family protein [Lachnospiraceae bacterium]
MKLTEKFYQEESRKIRSFLGTGLFTLSVILIAGLAITYSQKKMMATTTTMSDNLVHEKELPIYCVDTNQPMIALSLDAAWGNQDTRKILDILDKKQVKVTFFMTGGWIEKYPDDVKAIAAAGHELGNHSEHHKHMASLSAEECKKEIMSPHDKVMELTGVSMQVFRPPYGEYNDTLIQSLRQCGYHGIQWDVDSLDWKDYGVDSIIKTVLNHKNLGNGSIILCHNGAKYTAEALPKLIDGLREKGYEFVTMSDLIYDGEYTIDLEGRQHQKENAGNKSPKTVN